MGNYSPSNWLKHFLAIISLYISFLSGKYRWSRRGLVWKWKFSFTSSAILRLGYFRLQIGMRRADWLQLFRLDLIQHCDGLAYALLKRVLLGICHLWLGCCEIYTISVLNFWTSLGFYYQCCLIDGCSEDECWSPWSLKFAWLGIFWVYGRLRTLLSIFLDCHYRWQCLDHTIVTPPIPRKASIHSSVDSSVSGIIGQLSITIRLGCCDLYV